MATCPSELDRGWRIRPADYVVQVVFQDDAGNVRVFATASTPRVARRLRRKLERRYGQNPPPPRGAFGAATQDPEVGEE